MSTTPTNPVAATTASTTTLPSLSASSSPSISFITPSSSASTSSSLSPSSIPSKLFTTVEASLSRGDYIKRALSQPLSLVQERFAEVAPSFTSPTLLRNSGHWGITIHHRHGDVHH